MSVRHRMPAAPVLAAGAVLAVLAGPAHAMGSGNPYEDMQAGVTYTVYEPGYTAGLRTTTPVDLADGPMSADGAEENLAVYYGRPKAVRLSILENSQVQADPCNSEKVRTLTVGGRTGTLYACQPTEAVRGVSAARLFSANGGWLRVRLPARPGVRSTEVWVTSTGTGHLTQRALVRVARSLRPVGG